MKTTVISQAVSRLSRGVAVIELLVAPATGAIWAAMLSPADPCAENCVMVD
jgi:hypothetical protein